MTSVALPPTRDAGQLVANPKSAPTTVTFVQPVVARFLCIPTDHRSPAYVIALDSVALIPIDVNTVDNHALTPILVFVRTALSPNHTLASATLLPTQPVALLAANPTIVTNTDPDVPMLPRNALLSNTESAV